MSFSLNELVRPIVREMKPYSSARSSGSRGTLLDANELPWTPYSRYPEPQPESLIKALSHLYEVPKEQVMVTRGSDEAIECLLRAYCEPGEDAIGVCPPTFEIYAHSARIQNVAVLEAPLDQQFDVDMSAVERVLDQKIKMIFLCSPNNPTSNSLSPNKIDQILSRTKGQALVVLDEAYIEFSKRSSEVNRLKENPHLVILRTLSKYWGLAGLRLGAVLAHPEILSQVRKVLAPYPIPQPVVELAPALLQESPPDKPTLLMARDEMSEFISQLSFVKKVWPSDANFLLVQVDDSKRLVEQLEQKGIKIRDRSSLVPQAVRISIGFEADNRRLKEALKDLEGAL